MKFSYAPSRHAVSIDMVLEVDSISLYVANYIGMEQVQAFQYFICRLLTEDLDALYIEQLEREVGEEEGSGLGLLTLLNDYRALLAWKFEDLAFGSDALEVTTMARLTV